MPVLDATALDADDEASAFLRAILTPPESRTRPRCGIHDLARIASGAQPPSRRSASGVPLIGSGGVRPRRLP